MDGNFVGLEEVQTAKHFASTLEMQLADYNDVQQAEALMVQEAKQRVVSSWSDAFDAASENVNLIISKEMEQFKEKLQHAQLLLRQLREEERKIDDFASRYPYILQNQDLLIGEG
eukprot:m.128581 g.128581  ORF g.128581 m.128581 type:complete len:115 (-) comp9452_c4_seq6:933-1277(-)